MMSTNKIKVLNTGIRIRPSAIDGFYNCAYQWGKVFLEGKTSIPSARAAIGTSIHAAAEQMWTDAMSKGKKDANLGAMHDAAMEAWKEEAQKGIQFDDGENVNTATVEIIKGTEAFVEDIVPFSAIPDAVEEFFKIDVVNPIVAEIGGTSDYRQGTIIADIKTSRRKPTVSNYTVQQSTYKLLAEANGFPITENLIQGVVLKKEAEGMIMPIATDVPQAKGLINVMLETMEIIASDKVPIEMILRGNPKYYLCSPKYCALYPCMFVKGE